VQLKAQIDKFNQSITRKAVIRYLTIVVDMGHATLKQDMRPNRGIVIKNLLSSFIYEFAEMNPLSKLALIVTSNEGAEMLSDFN